MRTTSLPVILTLLAACGCSHAPAPVSEKPAPKQAAAAPFNIGSIFPQGAGRELVLSTCGSCHPITCTVRGQRTADRWDNIRKGHQDKLTSQSEADVTAMFAYLKSNFNDTKPEPAVPAELAGQGCTPF